MATEKTAAAKTTKVAKTPVSLVEKIKSQINQAALKNKITADELDALKTHITKVAGLIG